MSRAGKAVLGGASLVTLVAVALASFLPDARVWGINHLAYFPLSLRLTLLGLVVVGFVPGFARMLVEGFLSLVQALMRPGRAGIVLVIVVAVASVALFWSLRVGTSLLGDGHLLVRSFQAAQDGDTTLIPSSVRNILRSERIAMGTLLLYLGSARAAHEGLGMSWVEGWRFFNCILGGVFVFLLLWVARSPGWTAMTRLWLLVLVFFSSVMLLFFAYPENYTPLMVCLLLFVVAAVRALHFRASPWWSILALAVAVFLHVQALVLLPALVFLLVWRGHADPFGFVERRLPLVLGGLMALGVAVAWVTPLKRYLLRWVSQDGEQAVLTAGHAVDVINEVLLVFPAILLFAALNRVVASGTEWMRAVRPAMPQTPAASDRRSRRLGRRARRSATSAAASSSPVAPPAAWLRTRAEWNLFGLITWGCLLYLIFFDAEIGVARDWDLFAMIAFGLIPLALMMWNRAEASAAGFRLASHAHLVAPMLSLTLVLGVSWVLLNHSVAHATRRFEGILAWETAKLPYGLEALAASYADNGNVADAVRIMERVVELSPNKRLRALLGTYLFSAGQYQSAHDILRQELERDPEDGRLRMWLLRTLGELEDVDGQLDVLREGLEIEPANVRYNLLMGELLIGRGDLEEGIRYLRIGRQGDMPPAARAHVDRMIREAEARAAGPSSP